MNKSSPFRFRSAPAGTAALPVTKGAAKYHVGTSPPRSIGAEQEKYIGIYSSQKDFRSYGHTNHGKGALPLISYWSCESLLDIGCGYNEFVAMAQSTIPKIKALGVDFACPGSDIKACASDLPFWDKSFDVLTAFDMLEHLRPEQVSIVLREFARVSRRFIFSIAYVPSKITWKGTNLHPTVEKEEWWIRQIEKAGGTGIAKHGRFITGRWGPQGSPVPLSSSCVLVGNGPSVLHAKLGKLIDSYNEIIRFNSYKITGFEEFTGQRTTIWSTFGRGTLPSDIQQRPSKIIYIHGNNGKPAYESAEVWRIPLGFFNARRKEVQEGSGLQGADKERLLPSSGLLVASWLLDIIGVKKLGVIGFDHFKKIESKLHHYWMNKAYGRPKEHCGDYEATVFSRYAQEGRIFYLDGNKKPTG